MPDYHRLRYFGQSQQCCPVANILAIPSFEGYDLQNWCPRTLDEKAKINRLNPCEGSPERTKNITEFLKDSYAQFTPSTVLDEEDIQRIRNNLYYPHADYRMMVDFSLTTNQYYLEKGYISLKEQMNDEINYNSRKVNREIAELHTAEDSSEDNSTGSDASKSSGEESEEEEEEEENGTNTDADGFIGLWPFASLESSDYEAHVSYDAFHCLSGNAKYFLQLMKNERSRKSKEAQYCFDTRAHPYLWQYCCSTETRKQLPARQKITSKRSRSGKRIIDDSSIPWAFPVNVQEFVEECLECVAVPTGCGQEWEIRKIFSQTGKLKGMASIMLVTSVMDFVLFCVSIKVENFSKAYQTIYSMFSHLYSKLLAPIVSAEGVNILHNEIIEAVCYREGLFPVSESQMIVHELIHLATFFRQTGPARNAWTLAGERGIAPSKAFVPRGGRNPFCTSARKEFDYEEVLKRQFYSDSSRLISKAQKGDLQLIDGRLQYSDFAFKLVHGSSKQQITLNLSLYEKSTMLECMALEAIRLEPDEDTCLQSSSLYRLYYSSKIYEKKNIHKHFSVQSKFLGFLMFISLNRGSLPISALPSDEHEIAEKLNQLCLFECDIDSALTLTKDERFGISNITVNAIIWGTRFQGRGHECREYEPSDKVLNPDNILKNNYYKRDHISSWCRLYNIEGNAKYSLGQLNFFAEFTFPNDNIINKMMFASLTKRGMHSKDIGEPIKHLAFKANLFKVSSDTAIDYFYPFVCAYNILSTRLIAAAFDHDNTPINLHGGVGHRSKELANLILFSLQRQRECIHNDTMVYNKIHPYGKDVSGTTLIKTLFHNT